MDRTFDRSGDRQPAVCSSRALRSSFSVRAANVAAESSFDIVSKLRAAVRDRVDETSGHADVVW